MASRSSAPRRVATWLLLLLFPLAGLAEAPEPGEPALQQRLERVLDEEGLTGAAWVLLDGPEVRVGSAGLRDNEAGVAFTPDTRFHVGSVTKTLLATGVLHLATRGELDLDAPVARYLPDLAIDNPWRAEAPVTVRHLLDHTAGLDDARLWQMFSLRSRADAPLVDAFPEPGRQLAIRARPGSRFSYSNTGYTLLGMVVEAITGERYEAVLDRRLLAPLGMVDSTFEFTTQEGDGANARLAWGHVDDGSRYPAQPIFLRPAGQFTTTAGDLGRFLRFLLGDGTVDGEVIIAPELQSLRGRPTTTDAARAGLVAGYGLGIARRDRHGVVGLCHSGNIVGFAAMLCVFPEERRAFAYSVNTDSETARYGRIDALLIEALGIPPAEPPPSSGSEKDLAAWAGTYVLRPNRFASFAYLDELFGAQRIVVDGGALRLEPVQGEPRELRPLGDGLFSAGDRATASHVLLRSANGERQLSDGFRTLERVSDANRVARWTNLLLGLAGLAWFLGAGLVSLLRGRRAWGQPERLGSLAILGMIVPLPFFYAQPFMALGDLTVASALLALATVAIPFAAAVAGWRSWRRRLRIADTINLVASLAVLQWSAVLALAGMLPFRLWS